VDAADGDVDDPGGERMTADMLVTAILVILLVGLVAWTIGRKHRDDPRF
jgi:hypothetical protein